MIPPWSNHVCDTTNWEVRMPQQGIACQMPNATKATEPTLGYGLRYKNEREECDAMHIFFSGSLTPRKSYIRHA